MIMIIISQGVVIFNKMPENCEKSNTLKSQSIQFTTT